MARRLIGVFVAVVLAAVGTVVLVGYVRTAEQRALAGEEPVEVLVVREPVQEGTPASAIGERVDTELVPLKVRAAGGVDSIDELDGRVAAVDLVPGEQVVANRFVEPAVFEAAQEVEVPEGLQLITIPVNDTRAVGGQLRRGHTVGVIGSFSDMDGGADEEGQTSSDDDATGFLFHKALVTRVQTDAEMADDGQGAAFGVGGDDEEEDDVEAETAAAAQEEVERAPQGGFLITLAVDPEQAEKIVFAAEYGSIWLTLQPDHAEEGSSIQSRENIYQ